MFVALFWRIWAIFYPLDPDPDPHLLSVSRRQRRRIEGGRVCVGDRICSIPFRACCFVLVYLKEKVEFILFFQIDHCKNSYSAARN